MHDIRTRLLRAEDDLLLALSSGSLQTFENEWSQLSREIMLATKEKWLSEGIQVLANTVSTRIHAIASFFHDLDTKDQDLAVEEVSSSVLKETLSNCQSPASTKPAIPPYIPLAYAWLLDNLHCPYPSTSMRDSLAKESGSSRKAIDGWFIDVRRRIGWNALRRTRFCGKKDEIIRAASLFFCENKSNDSAGLEFASVEVAARDLYAEKLRPSAFASRFADAVERRPSNKNHSASVILRKYTAFPSPLSSPASSVSYPITPSSKRIRSFDETEPETPDLIHTCQRPSKRQRFISKLPSPVSSRGTWKSRSSSPDQPSCNLLSESHPLQLDASQCSLLDNNFNSSHQLSKQAKSILGASSNVECNRASSFLQSQSHPIHFSNSSSSAQPSLGDEDVLNVSQVGHHRRSEVGSQLPSDLETKSLLKSASASVFDDTTGVTCWPFDSVAVQADSVFGSLDDKTECEVATFDFSTWSPESLDQTELSMPLQVLSPSGQMSFSQHNFPSSTFIATPSDDNLGSSNNTASLGDELSEIFDFIHDAPSRVDVTTLPAPSSLHEPGSINAGFPSKLGHGISNTPESFSWGDVPNSIQDFLGPLVPQPTLSEAITSLSENDKSKKLKLLADVQEFAHRLEAEIAVM